MAGWTRNPLITIAIGGVNDIGCSARLSTAVSQGRPTSVIGVRLAPNRNDKAELSIGRIASDIQVSA